MNYAVNIGHLSFSHDNIKIIKKTHFHKKLKITI